MRGTVPVDAFPNDVIQRFAKSITEGTRKRSRNSSIGHFLEACCGNNLKIKLELCIRGLGHVQSGAIILRGATSTIINRLSGPVT